MNKLIVICAALLCGCASVKTTEISGPSGVPGYIINCKNAEGCYSEAGKLCPSGYNLVDQSSGRTAYVPVGGIVHSVTAQNLVIECKT